MVLTTDPPVDEVTAPDPTLEEKRLEEEKADEADSEGEDDALTMKETASTRQHSAAPAQEKPIVEDDEEVEPSGNTVQMPYGLPCCRELLRFLIALSNPLDRQNTESMVILGLNLLTVALEAAADHLASYSFLVPLLKDNLCRSLLQLLDTEKLPVLAATNRACFLLFESMRSQLKVPTRGLLPQAERHCTERAADDELRTERDGTGIDCSALANTRLGHGIIPELRLNVFEELTKLLVENAFPMSGLHAHSLISLDALLVVIDMIDQNCLCRQAALGAPQPEADPKVVSALPLPILSGYEIGQRILASGSDYSNSTPERAIPESMPKPLLPSANRHAPSHRMPSMEQVIDQKKRKRIFAEGTELFNQSPKKGIEYLREKGLLDADAKSVVHWLRTNPQLDKKKIADYICSRKHADVLEAFVQSFPFENTRLDDALRMFLETFRLPGEAAEISMVMQHFSDQWYKANHEPFNHVDAAFTLSYAIIMLNTDQHNPTVRRNQPPMTVDCFKRNLSGTNGGADFDPEMLMTMYNAIKSEEIVMPAEQTGIVKENYLWKVLLRRGESAEGHFEHAPTGWNDHDLFSITWGPAVAALTYVFDKSEHDVILQKALNGFRKCASIAAHYGMKDVFDNLIIHLCKFSTLASNSEGHGDDNLEMQRQRNLNEVTPGVQHERIAVAFGENRKAQMATKTMFELVHASGDILREGWRNLLDCLLQLFRARLLPPELTEVDDFVDEKGWVSLIRDHVTETQPVRSESGLLSWFGLGGGTSESERKKLTQEQQNSIKLAQSVIAECRPSQLFTDSKYLTSTALSELLNALIHASQAVVQQADSHKPGSPLNGENEDALVFYLELIVTICLFFALSAFFAKRFFFLVCDTLSFLLRDAIHVTPDNFESCVACLRTMVEASLDGGRYAAGPLSGDAQNRLRSHVDDRVKRPKAAKPGKKDLSTDVTDDSEIRREEQQLTASYQQVSLQLLDLCSTLHNLAPGILAQWAKTQPEVDASVPHVWSTVWRPLLQAIARLGCDCRRLVRASALTHLQRAFLPTNMVNLGAAEWESCFGEVLFPLLGKLLDVFSAMDPIGMEDTRVRAMQIVAKTLLNHLTALSTLPSFPSLWLRLLDFMESYLRIDSCGNLNEAVPESLKNMLLVMASTGLFASVPGLHQMTVSRMGNVLPQLIRDTLPEAPPPVAPAQPEPKSLTSVASASRMVGSRVQIAPAIPSSAEESLPFATTTPAAQPSVAPAASVADSAPLSTVPASSDHSHPYHETAPITSADKVPATAPVNIPELTEVVVHSGAVSPASASSPVTGSLPLSTASQYSMVSTAADADVASDLTAQAPSSSHTQAPPPVLPKHPSHQSQQHYQEVSSSPPVSQSQYYSQRQQQQYQQYPNYAVNYHPAAAAAYAQHQQYLQQQHQQYMPQADLAKAFATPVPPQYSTSTSAQSTQYSVTNPLPLPSMPLIASPHSAFTQVSDLTHQQSFVPTHQNASFHPTAHPPQERP
ncbi:hypothetical protein COOONC_03206 [Cooperia oncophora]